jgi:hypothetical protein
VENLTYFNVGRVNGILMQMQQRIDLLEGRSGNSKPEKERSKPFHRRGAKVPR